MSSWRPFATYLGARAVPALAALAVALLCIHALAPEDYAVYSVAMLAIGMAGGFVGHFAGQPMLRYSHDLRGGALAVGLSVLPALAALLVLPLLAWYVQRSTGHGAVAWLAAAALPLLALVDTRRQWFVAHAQAGRVFQLDALRAGSALVATAALLQWRTQPDVPLLALAVSLVVALLAVVPRATARAGATRRIDAHYLGYGLGLAGWVAAVAGMALAERAALASVADGLVNGRYAAQADIVNAYFAAVGGAFGAALMPAFLAHAGRSAETGALRQLLQTSLLGVFAMGLLCVLGGALLGAFGVGQLAQGIEADPLTALLLVAAAAVWTATGFVQKPLELQGRTQPILWGAVAVLLLFLFAAPLAAAQAGAAGVAAAKLAAGLLYGALAWWAGR